MMSIIVVEIIFIFENIFVILLCTPEKFFKDFLAALRFIPKLRQTMNAEAAFITLCLPNNFTLIFLIILIFFFFIFKS